MVMRREEKNKSIGATVGGIQDRDGDAPLRGNHITWTVKQSLCAREHRSYC